MTFRHWAHLRAALHSFSGTGSYSGTFRGASRRYRLHKWNGRLLTMNALGEFSELLNTLVLYLLYIWALPPQHERLGSLTLNHKQELELPAGANATGYGRYQVLPG